MMADLRVELPHDADPWLALLAVLVVIVATYSLGWLADRREQLRGAVPLCGLIGIALAFVSATVLALMETVVWRAAAGAAGLAVPLVGLTIRMRQTVGAAREETQTLLRTQEAVTNGAARLNEIERITHLGSWTWEIPTGRKQWSDEQYRIFGYEPGAVVPTYDSFLQALHPDDRERVTRAVAATLEDGVPYGLEFRIIRPDGDVRHLYAQGEVSRDGSGNPLRMIGTVLDVTYSKIVEQLLESSERRLAAIIGTAMDAMVCVDDAQRILMVNGAAERLFGYRASEVLGRRLDLLLPGWRTLPLAAPCPNFQAYEPTAGRHGQRSLGTGRRSDGEEFPVEAACSVFDEGGRRVYTVILRDISERVKADRELAKKNQELAEARDRALEAVRIKAEFLARMGHELRTPMNAVIGLSELLLTSDVSAPQRRQLETLRRSGEGLLQLINDLLDFSKVEQGKLVLEEVEFDLVGLISDVHSLLKDMAEKKRLAIEIPRDEPAPRFLVGDPLRLKQILVNLMGNAIKFTDQGTVKLVVETVGEDRDWSDDVTEQEGSNSVVPRSHRMTVRFTVRDTGIGIEPTMQKRLFTPFTQADRAMTQRYGGAGLGLAIAKRLVESMGGAITLQSAPGVGSTFSFTARFGVATRDGSRQGRLEEPQRRPSWNAHGQHLLEPRVGAFKSPHAAPRVFDLERALESADGDRQFLKHLAALFVKNATQGIAELREALAQRDAGMLMRRAHKLKGTIAVMAAPAAYEAAKMVERMGQHAQLDAAEAGVAILQEEVRRLTEALKVECLSEV